MKTQKNVQPKNVNASNKKYIYQINFILEEMNLMY